MVAGLLLFGLKQFLDRSITARFGHIWTPELYWSPIGVPVYSVHGMDRDFVLALAYVAVPFALLGVWLTTCRLKKLELPWWSSLLFFVPVLNLFFFAFLVITNQPSAPADHSLAWDWWPRAEGGSFALASTLSALLATLTVGIAVKMASAYGWGLFFGVPFAIALLTTLLHSMREERSFGSCVAASLIALVICAALMLSVAIEGVVCLVMCLPLAIPLLLLGVAVGRTITKPSPHLRHGVPVIFLAAAIFPAIAANPGGIAKEENVFAVITAVEVDAPPEKVWENVIRFPELPPPQEWIFGVGISYPMRARIEGEGVGAVRFCEFSTGPFVEPITKWDAPRLLAFTVSSSPSPMRELSPYEIHPPHLDGFLRSHRGQFRLEPLDGGKRTRLEGTTWYSLRLYPAGYWRLWSDWILHTIHQRVLDHIRRVSANAGAP